MPATKTATLKRPLQPMPAWVRDALNAQGLMPAYLERPPYQRNDYLGWIARAKQQATQQKRAQQMLDELRGGRLYMNMAWKPASRRG